MGSLIDELDKLAELEKRATQVDAEMRATWNLFPELLECAKVLRVFAAMDRPNCDLSEMACSRGVGFDRTAIFSGDFRKAANALDALRKKLEVME